MSSSSSSDSGAARPILCMRCEGPVLDDQSYVAATNGVRHMTCPKDQAGPLYRGKNKGIDVDRWVVATRACTDCWAVCGEDHAPDCNTALAILEHVGHVNEREVKCWRCRGTGTVEGSEGDNGPCPVCHSEMFRRRRPLECACSKCTEPATFEGYCSNCHAHGC